MKKLRVIEPFRDENNFFTIHQKGDTVIVSDIRATRLIEGGFCEKVKDNAGSSDTPELETTFQTVDERPKRATRKKKQL